MYSINYVSGSFLGGSVVKKKNPPANASSIPGSGRSPGEGKGNLLQYSCLENSHGWRSLAGYSPWGYKESDTTERLTHTNSNLNLRNNTDCVWFDNKVI